MPIIDKKYLDEYYAKQMSRLGKKDFTLYGSKLSQMTRFERVVSMVDFRGKSILDVGCGICEFRDYLKSLRIGIGDYVGTEVMDNVFKGAVKINPGLDVRFGDILGGTNLAPKVELEVGRKFDMVLALGVSAIKLGSVRGSDTYWGDFLEKMYELTAEDGVAVFTCFSNKKSDIRPEDYVADPVDWLNFAMRLTDRVIIDHSYMPHDFTIYLFKGDSKWKKEWKKKGGWKHV